MKLSIIRRRWIIRHAADFDWDVYTGKKPTPPKIQSKKIDPYTGLEIKEPEKIPAPTPTLKTLPEEKPIETSKPLYGFNPYTIINELYHKLNVLYTRVAGYDMFSPPYADLITGGKDTAIRLKTVSSSFSGTEEAQELLTNAMREVLIPELGYPTLKSDTRNVWFFNGNYDEDINKLTGEREPGAFKIVAKISIHNEVFVAAYFFDEDYRYADR